MFSLFKLAELGSAARNFKSGTYSWEKVPEIATAFKGEFDLVGVAAGGWLWELLGVAVFDVLERTSSSRRSRDEVLALILADPAFAGKDASSAEVKQEIGARMRAQSGQESASPDQVIASSASPAGLSKLVTALAGAGMPLSEAHTYIQLADQQGPESFSDSRTISAFSSRVNQLRAEQAASAVKSKSITFESNNPIMEYIRQHSDVGGGLTIEAFGATHHTQTDSEASKGLEARCLAEQNEGGGVCVHSVHLNKVLGGISLFASVRGPKREHIATIKFEDNLIYEIKGHNNSLVANQLELSETEKQVARSAVQGYLTKMLASGVVDGFSRDGEADFANLMHPDAISNIIDGGAEDYSTILPSQKLTPAQIEIIWERIRGGAHRVPEFVAMAGNKNTPPGIQLELLNIGNKDIDSALARNENLDAKIHDQLANHGDRLVRHRALAHRLGYEYEIDQDEVFKMLTSKDSKVVARAVTSPLAPRERLLELGMDPRTDPNIKANLLVNKSINLETKQAIFDTMPSSAQLSILEASTYGASSDDIRRLRLPDSFVLPEKISLGLARALSPAHLKKLLDRDDLDDLSLWRLVQNKNADLAFLGRVALHPNADRHALWAIAGNKNVDIGLLRFIAKNPKADYDALREVAKSEDADLNLLDLVVRHPKASDAVLLAVARNKVTDLALLGSIVNHPKVHYEALMAVMDDPKTDLVLLKQIAANQNALVPDIIRDVARLRIKKMAAGSFPLFKRSNLTFNLFR